MHGEMKLPPAIICVIRTKSVLLIRLHEQDCQSGTPM
jgi:hypothetical protein